MDRNNAHGAVDIVVPVYNGYEDLLRCIESLHRHTDLSRHRVLLIDDCSPDERVRTVLKEVCAGSDVHSDHGMIAVFNEKNRGFSANVNTGLSWSGRDTILLNSDTIVTERWVIRRIPTRSSWNGFLCTGTRASVSASDSVCMSARMP